MFAFWPLIMGARFLMILLFYPILRYTGYGITMKEIYVLVWGSLRGAFGMTLALIVAFDDALPPRLKELTIFYMCGVATLTLLGK
jgi:NhaP-type Na+/H+ or K+/H+ antiporter